MKRNLNALVLGTGVLVLSMAAAYAQSSGRGPYYAPQRDDPNYRSDPSYRIDPNYRNDPNYRSYPNRDGYSDDRYSQPRGYSNQERYGNDRYGDGRNQGSLIGRVLEDLQRAAGNARLDRRERNHFDDASRQLEQFEDRWAQGKFDSGKLHEAIEDLEHLARANRLSGRDRETLARDTEDLRQFRSTRGRNSDPGYGDNRGQPYKQNRSYNPNWR